MAEVRRTIERYELCDRIGSGGMGAVHLGTLHGSAGFRRIVAIKRLHPEYLSDRDFVRAFVEEARVAARIRHPNVVPILDTLRDNDELFLVLEYIHGETLSRLMGLREHHPPPISVSAAIMRGVLEGLHAAHSAADERGAPMTIVHRDISPQNILVGVDGVPRVLDFGVATAQGRSRRAMLERRGKLSYMAPEQIVSGETSPRSDIYSASVVLWESLTGKRLFNNNLPLTLILDVELRPPSAFNSAVGPALDRVVMRGLERNPALRYTDAREMSMELESAVVLATMREIGHWVDVRAGALLRARAARIATIERRSAPKPGTDLHLEPEATPLPEFHEFDEFVDTTTRGPHRAPNAAHITAIETNTIPTSSIHSNPIRSNSIRSNPIRSNSVHTNAILTNAIASNAIASNAIASNPSPAASSAIHPPPNAILSFDGLAFDARSDFHDADGHRVVITTQRELLDWTSIPTLGSPGPMDAPDDVDLVPTQTGTVVPEFEDPPPIAALPLAPIPDDETSTSSREAAAFPELEDEGTAEDVGEHIDVMDAPTETEGPPRARVIALASLLGALLILLWFQIPASSSQASGAIAQRPRTVQPAEPSEPAESANTNTPAVSGSDEDPKKDREVKRRSSVRIRRANQDPRRNRSMR